MKPLNRDSILASLSIGVEDHETDTGVLTAAGPLDTELLTRVFQLLNTATKHTWDQDAGHDMRYPLEAVDPKFVLARAWNPDRLIEQKECNSKGVQTHSPDLVRVRFPGLPDYYLVTDGMHRTVAARLARKPYILARVGRYQGVCDPEHIVVNDGCVKIWTPCGTIISGENTASEYWDWRAISHLKEEPAGYVGVLEALGIAIAVKKRPLLSQLAHLIGLHD